MKVKIGNCDYKIIEVNDKFDKELWDKEKNELKLYGLCDNVNGIIKIWKDLPYDRKRRTLTHELTHAFLNVYWESYTIKERYDNEDMCCFMETFGADIVRMTNEYFLEKSSRFINEIKRS